MVIAYYDSMTKMKVLWLLKNLSPVSMIAFPAIWYDNGYYIASLFLAMSSVYSIFIYSQISNHNFQCVSLTRIHMNLFSPHT